jgi:hypothetical protein
MGQWQDGRMKMGRQLCKQTFRTRAYARTDNLDDSDYVKGGSYADASLLPSLDSIERFVSVMLWARAVSGFWQQE